MLAFLPNIATGEKEHFGPMVVAIVVLWRQWLRLARGRRTVLGHLEDEGEAQALKQRSDITFGGAR
jgi:hypothetical protein